MTVRPLRPARMRTAALGAALAWLAAVPALPAVAAAPGTPSRPGVSGTGTPPPPPSTVCDASPTTSVPAVQGAGGTSPLQGEQAIVHGTVVAVLPGLSGFHLQDPLGDGRPETSDAVFVFSPVAVGLGDTVAVSGQVQEFAGQTQISARADVAVCADGSADELPAPAPLDLPAGDAERERLEGMRVAPADALTVSEVFDLTSFGELTLSQGGRLVQPTELARPGTAEAAQVAADGVLRRIVLDDGRSGRVGVTTRPYLSPGTPVRVGDELSFTEPLVLGYGFGQWRLQPADGTAEGVFAPQDTRPDAPEAVGGDVQVGAFNVLNYFLTFDGPDARGARDQEQLDRQAGKIVPAVLALGAEVVTLMEIEDTDSTGHSPGNADAALADLVSRMNAVAGEGTWDYVPLPQELYGVDRDVIRNAIVYQPRAVGLVGDPVGLVDEAVWSNAREPQAQRFRVDGDTFTVVANHFKSKSPGDATGDNVDAGDGQGAWNGDRVRQAESLAEFTRRLRARTREADVLLMGDLNAYTQEDPVEVLRERGYVDLGERLDPGRYSYVFDDRSGSLDHALATGPLTAKVTGLTHWDINAVESSAFQYTGDPALYRADPYRSSDHDPLVLGIDVQERCQGRAPTVLGTEGDDVLRGTGGADVVMGLGGDDTVVGSRGRDVVCGGTGDDRLEGGRGADVLLGGLGDDRLIGGAGRDRLVGGPGDDVVVQGVEPEPLAVQLLALNDFHGNLEPPSGSGGRIQTDAAGATVDAGGAEFLAEQLRELAAEQRKGSTITVAAGDLIGASPLLSAAFHDEPTIEALGLAGLDYASVGNHEFDEGATELRRLQDGGCHPVDGCADGTPYRGADFQYLSANAFVTVTGEPLLAPYAVHRVQGVDVGFIGMTLEGTGEIVSQEGVAGLDFTDEVETADRYAAELQARGVESIVVLLHQGGTQTGPGAWDVNGCAGFQGPVVGLAEGMSDAVDVIVSGHTHQAYDCEVDGKLVTSASSNGRLVTDIDLSIDRRTGDVLTARAHNVVVTRDVPADPAQSRLIARYREALGPLAQEVVGETAEPLTRTQEQLFPTGTGPTGSPVYALGESALGNLVADAQLAATDEEAGAGAAFMNPGGVRADLDRGPVTYEEAFTVQPFANNLVTLDLTGGQVQCLLEQQFQVGRTLYASEGVAYTVDARGATAAVGADPCAGSRVLDETVRLGGEPVVADQAYRVTVNTFLAGGGDGFSVLTSGTRLVTGAIDLDALTAYLAARSPVPAPRLDRITVQD